MRLDPALRIAALRRIRASVWRAKEQVLRTRRSDEIERFRRAYHLATCLIRAIDSDLTDDQDPSDDKDQVPDRYPTRT